MSVLVDWEIKKLGLLTNMVEKQHCPLSYGLEPSGYTLRLSNEYLIPTNENGVLDPMDKENTSKLFKKVTVDDYYLLKPKSFILGVAKERFNLPNNVTAIALTKSSYARVSVFCNITTIDAGFKGDLVIEIANLGNRPVKVYSHYGIAEVLFFKHGNTDGYEGNYQNQNGIKV
jgi:deoxycytidine triphosphate deaminase